MFPNAEMDNLINALQRTRKDATFRTEMLESPGSALAGAGVNVPSGMTVKTYDGGDGTTYVVLPPAPNEGEVSDADLADASGGGTIAFAVAVVVTFAVGIALDQYGKSVNS